MAKSAVNQLKVTVRTETGKGASRRARRDGKIPAVLYGHGADPQHLELPGHDFAAVLRHAGTNAVLTLDIEGKEQLALTKALDIHPIRRTIQHADLLVVRRGEKVVVEVTVVVEGDAESGTLVTQETNHIEIEAEALSIPEQLTVSVEGAPPGTQFTAGPGRAAEGRQPDLRPGAAGGQCGERADRRGPRGRGRGRDRRARRAEEEARGRGPRPRPSRRDATWPSRCWSSAWAIPETATPAPGITSGSWWPTCSPRGWARNSRRTSVPARRSSADGWPGTRW